MQICFSYSRMGIFQYHISFRGFFNPKLDLSSFRFFQIFYNKNLIKFRSQKPTESAVPENSSSQPPWSPHEDPMKTTFPETCLATFVWHLHRQRRKRCSINRLDWFERAKLQPPRKGRVSSNWCQPNDMITWKKKDWDVLLFFLDYYSTLPKIDGWIPKMMV